MPNATVRANARTLPNCITDTPRLRRRLADAAERIIAVLDTLDAPAEDVEDDDPAEESGDLEPTLGATNHRNQAKAWNASFAGDDLEYEGGDIAECDLEDSHDREDDPAESGIGDIDGYREQIVGEPEFGSTLDFDQRIAWGADRAATAFGEEASGTVEDLRDRGHDEEAWKARRAASDNARAQLQAVLQRRRARSPEASR